MERLAFVEQHYEIASEPAPRPNPFVFITFASELTDESTACFFFAEACDD
jgi:hypothetical protein